MSKQCEMTSKSANIILGCITGSIDFRIREVKYPVLLCLKTTPGIPHLVMSNLKRLIQKETSVDQANHNDQGPKTVNLRGFFLMVMFS